MPGRGLQLEEDERFFKRHERVEKVGWAAFASIVVLSFIGVLANGPLTRATLRGDGLTVVLPRVLHFQSSSALTFQLQPGRDGAASMWIDQDVLEALSPVRFIPQPTRQRADGKRVRFSFEGTPGAAPLVVRMEVEPARPGWVDGRAAQEGHAPVGLWAWVFP